MTMPITVADVAFGTSRNPLTPWSSVPPRACGFEGRGPGPGTLLSPSPSSRCGSQSPEILSLFPPLGMEMHGTPGEPYPKSSGVDDPPGRRGKLGPRDGECRAPLGAQLPWPWLASCVPAEGRVTSRA